MGKQKGTAERSKFKAASSSEFGNGQTGFFTGFGQEQLDQNLDPRLRVALRKISKKDATTKVCFFRIPHISQRDTSKQVHTILRKYLTGKNVRYLKKPDSRQKHVKNY